LVSIVIPVFNGSAFLAQAIESALNQSYQNIEVIVVDDGSTDEGRTRSIAKRFGGRVQYVWKENGGVASALNCAIGKMSGKYFSWLSHDDLYKPDKVRRQVDLLRSLGFPQAIVFGGYDLIDESGRRLRTISPHLLMSKDQLEVPLASLLRGLINGCTLLVPKELFLRFGTFNEQLLTTQDYDLWFRMLRKTSIVYESSIEVLTRQHSDQCSRRMHDRHLLEGNTLWRGFLDSLTPEEMRTLGDTPTSFLRAQAAFLASTPFADAATHAAQMADAAINQLKVSVVVPFRDRIDWTIQCVRSVQAQTHQNWELLLIDDGSTENTGPLTELARIDSRIRILRGGNTGAAQARNMGIDIAQGDYVSFLDSDDLFMPHKLSTQLSAMEAHGYRMTFTSYVTVNRCGHFLEVKRMCRVGRKPTSESLIHRCPIATPTVMIHRSAIGERRFPSLWPGEDVCLWLDLAANSEWSLIDEPLSIVRMHGRNAGYDSALLRQGMRNVLGHCERQPALARHTRAIAALRNQLRNLPASPSSLSQRRARTLRNLPWRLQRETIRLLSRLAQLI
jgi:hypothetical protein